MNQNQPVQMVPVPVPVGPHVVEYHGNEVPARVRVALEFLQGLTRKTQTIGLVNDVGFSEIEGQRLVVEEQAAQCDALKMLRCYFQGQLAPNQWEVNMAVMAKQRHIDIATCPKCGGEPAKKPKCRFCGGKGQIAVQ